MKTNLATEVAQASRPWVAEPQSVFLQAELAGKTPGPRQWN
jgi:hypothetical protein